jgi:hypothetical protein
VKTTPCRGCGKPIAWIQTAEGTRVPLDPRAPVYQIVGAPLAPFGPYVGMRSPVMFTDGDETFNGAMVSHFATCPKASEFSASKKKPESHA